MRRFAYVNCTCGLLVRCEAVPAEHAAELAKLNAHGFVGACPNCKATATLTIQAASVIQPATSLPPPHPRGH